MAHLLFAVLVPQTKCADEFHWSLKRHGIGLTIELVPG